MTTFLEYGATVLDRRAQAGIRGIVSERHRWQLHVATAAFAPKGIESISPKDVREWLREMSVKKARDTRGDRTLSPRSVARSFALVSAMFAAAVEDELRETNPCNGVKVPKRADARETQEKWTYLTLDEQRTLAACETIPHEHRVAIRFAIATGLRQGEQMNLHLDDLHVDGPDAHVFVRFGSPGLPPKSGKTRAVPLFGDGIAAAREALALANAHPNNPDRLVFPSPSGRVRAVGKPLGRVKAGGRHVCAWKQALRAAGLARRVKWHSLRHTCATNLVTGVLGRRWTLEEIQPLMGHSAIAITQIYAHVGESALKRAAAETASAIPAEAPAANDNGSLVRRVVSRIFGRVASVLRRAA